MLASSPSHTKNSMITLISLASATFGVSVLGLPTTMAKAGVIEFMVLLFFSAVLNYYSSMCFVHFAETKRLKTFADFSRKVCSRNIRMLNDVFYILANTGALLVALVFMNVFMCSIMRQLVTYEFLTNPKYLFWLFVFGLISFPIVLKRQLKDVAFVTILSVVAMFALLYLLLYWLLFRLESVTESQIHSTEKVKNQSFVGILFFMIYLLGYQANLISIYDEIDNKSIPKMRNFLLFHSLFFYIYYFSIGLIGCLLFRSDSGILTHDVLSMFPQGNYLVIGVNILMVATSFVGFICAFKSVKETIIDYFIKKIELAASEHRDIEKEYLDSQRTVLITTIILLFALVFTSGTLERSNVNFIQIIDTLSLMVAPVVSLIIPVMNYAKDQKSTQAWAVFGILIILYIFGNLNQIRPLS